MSNTYSYNGLGQRSGKVDSTGTFNFTRNSDAIDAPVVSDGAARYVQGATGLLSESRGGTSKYYHADALGSTRAITNTSGVVTDTKATDAFGITYTQGTSGSTPTPWGFAGAQGYQSDSDTGLMLLGHRYYDSSIGRFLSRDPIQAGANWYVYCGNDPVNAADPTGNVALVDDLIILGVILIIVVIVVVTSPDFQDKCRKLGGAIARAVEDDTPSPEPTIEVIQRPNPGRDGGQSRHLKEKVDGETVSITHQVEVNGEVVHQHQTHVGKSGAQRVFPDEWVEHPKIP